MTPLTQPVPIRKPTAEPAASLTSTERKAPGSAAPPMAKALASGHGQDDGTHQLLKWGGWILGAGLFFALLTRFALGGIGPQGPHTNGGWMALIITMMCLPFGFLLFLLGALKWLRNRRHSG